MKKLTSFSFSYLFVAIVFLFVSCENPTANFDYEVVGGGRLAAPCTIKFTSLSLNAEGHSWDFGDGTTSTARYPEHTFEEPGTYTVTLTAVNKRNKEKSVSKDITIENTPGKAILKGVTLKRIPLEDFQGNPWDDVDNGTYPDVFFEFSNGASVTFYSNESQFITDVDANKLPIHWDLATPFEIPVANYNKNYYFDIEDKDDDISNEVIAYTQMKFADYIFSPVRFPSKFTVETDDFEAEFELEWE